MSDINSELAKDLIALKIECEGQQLWLDPLRAVFWEEKSALFISDLHMGKAGHFRKAGYPLPDLVGKNNLWNLSLLIDKYQPQKVIFLGDLFHSSLNEEWDQLVDLRRVYSKQNWILVSGNHDILEKDLYHRANLMVHEELYVEPFKMVHEPVERPDSFIFCGHIHPCVSLRGKANQSLRLPCFWISKNQMVFPAFGDFTGTHRIRPGKNDQVYVIAGKKVVKV